MRVKKAERATVHRRLAIPTAVAAVGPKSGPTTMAATMRMGESESTPMPAIMVAAIIRMRYVALMDASSLVRLLTSSQMTASMGEPGTSTSALAAACDSTSRGSTTVSVPSSSTPSSRRRPITSSPASRTTVAEIMSPMGIRLEPRVSVRVTTPG